MPRKQCSSSCHKARQCRKKALETEVKHMNLQPTVSNQSADDVDEFSDATEYQNLPAKKKETPYVISERKTRSNSRSSIHDRVNTDFEQCLDSSQNPRRRSGKIGKRIYVRPNAPPIPETPRNHTVDQQTEEIPKEAIPSDGTTPETSPEREKRKCPNEECAPRPVIRFGLRKNVREAHKSSSQSSTTSTEPSSDSAISIPCPELCKIDPAKLPVSSPRCPDSCAKQAHLDLRREKFQAAADDYVLHAGFRYFDNLCVCSLKCLVTGICQDPFVGQIFTSAVFFFVGVKVMNELDGWYIPFKIGS